MDKGMGVVDSYVYLLKKKSRNYPYHETTEYVFVDRRRAWQRCDQLNAMDNTDYQYSIQPMSVH